MLETYDRSERGSNATLERRKIDDCEREGVSFCQECLYVVVYISSFFWRRCMHHIVHFSLSFLLSCQSICRILHIFDAFLSYN